MGADHDVEKPSAQPEFSVFLGASVEDRITLAVASAPVVIFGKSYCPFCLEVKRTFDQLGVKYHVYDVDGNLGADGTAVWEALKKLHAPQRTVPYVYINKVMIGGCDATKKLQYEGELDKMLAAAGITVEAAGGSAGMAERIAKCGVLVGAKRAGGTLFHFPEAVDNRVVRMNGAWSFIICLLCAIYYKRDGSHWVMGGLMVEYALRLMAGGNFSALGSLSAAIASVLDAFGSKPKWVAGPPKQFATLCGLMFSTLAFFFFLVSVHEVKLRIVGLSFTCALGAAALMESAIDFCLGCWMFGLMIQFGILPGDVYTTYTNSRAEIEHTWEDANKRLKEGPPEVIVKHFSDEHPTEVDYKYKTKTEDMTKEDFHPIKHVKLTHFVMHMGVVGLACAWNTADTGHGAGLDAPAAVWQAIGIFSAIWYGTWCLLYALKIFMYPRKVMRELMDNVSGNCAALPFIILVLFAYIERDRDPVFAKVLFWIGAPTSLAISFVVVGNWIADKKEIEHINSSWMLMPVANFVAAAVGPLLDSEYRDAMQMWFAFAFIMWLALFAIMLYRSFVMPDYDDRVRGMMATWVAAPAIAAHAYLSCYGMVGPVQIPGNYNDFIFINLYWMAITLAIVIGWLFVRPYQGRLKFDMSYWAGGFPSAALAMCSILYYVLKPGQLSEAIAYTTLAISSWIHATLLLQTAAGIVRLKVFTPNYKWGPLSFMRLTHEALRTLMKRVVEEAKCANNDPTSAMAFRATWDNMMLMFVEHSKHEDDVFFPTYNDIIPGVTHDADEQHHALHATLESLNAAVTANKLDGIVAQAEAFYKLGEDHLRYEEDHLQGMPRKYVPLELAKQTVRKVWGVTPAATWYRLLPLLVNSMPMLHQRVRFIKTLLWAMPERGQQFGLMLAIGTDAVQWRRITEELPEIIPRGADGWKRYF